MNKLITIKRMVQDIIVVLSNCFQVNLNTFRRYACASFESSSNCENKIVLQNPSHSISIPLGNRTQTCLIHQPHAL